MLIKDCIDDFLLNCEIEDLSEKTISNRRQELGKFEGYMREKRGVEEVSRLTVHDLKAYIRSVQQRKLKPASVRAYYFAVQTFLNFCVAERHLASNPLVEVPTPKKRVKQVQAFSDSEVKRMLGLYSIQGSFRGARTKTLLALLADTGIRANELLEIKLSDIRGSQLHIRFGKGRRERYVFLSPVMQRWLTQYLRCRERYFTEHLLREPDYVFVTSTEGAKLSYSGLYQIITFAGKKAGIEGVRCSAHTFRHYYAIQSLKNGMDLFTLSKLLGHSDLATTQIYLGSMGYDAIEVQAKQHSPLMGR
ncbi:tyrosine-type recombinase/integrase [Listeria grandensis]|uniref:Tyrosine-type recombinase/integrase n=2 Tax=Listeria grandensis TaxID=1494963 RepID=A0A7X0Y1A9_9LIST|nr:tyrosine-type recombinase/integrase [Listeria grandensis]MBC1935121.1 tyrosine-type recombinase/integrase [Listeria grandensis]